MLSCSVMSDSLTPWTAACQAPLFMGFSRQEYWSGVHALLQGIFPTQGSTPGLPHCRILYCLNQQGSPFLGGKGKEKKGGAPLGLSVLDTDFFVCVGPDLLIHPCSFNCFGTLCLCWNSQSLFLCCKLVCLLPVKFCLVFTSYALFSLCLPDWC